MAAKATALTLILCWSATKRLSAPRGIAVAAAAYRAVVVQVAPRMVVEEAVSVVVSMVVLVVGPCHRAGRARGTGSAPRTRWVSTPCRAQAVQ